MRMHNDETLTKVMMFALVGGAMALTACGGAGTVEDDDAVAYTPPPRSPEFPDTVVPVITSVPRIVSPPAA